MTDSSSNLPASDAGVTNQAPSRKHQAPAPGSTREHLRVTVYTPHSGVRHPLELFKGMLSDTFCHRSRDFAWRMFVKNVSALYRQSLLGYLWILIPPVLTAFVWVFLNRSKVLNIALDSDVPYPLYVLTGNLIWQGATQALAMPINTLNAEKGTLTKINIPRESLLVAGFLQALLSACIPMVLLVPIMIYFKVVPSLGLLLGFGLFILAVMSSYIVGTFLTPVGLLYRDIARLIPVVNRFWFFITPIAFAIPASGWSRYIFIWNPATSFLDTSRNLILGQPLNAELLPFLAGYGLLSVAVLFFSLVLYRLSMPIIIERMSA